MPASPSIAVQAHASPSSVPLFRHRAAEFAAAHGAGRALVADVALAISEAVTNAVKYSQAPAGAAEVELTGSNEGDWLEFRVLDRGQAFEVGESDGLGLGLSIIARLCSELTIVQEGKGTEVRMRFALAS
ncbi:MAG TPA: ATP-binding protein [Solirubrobacterales bacterium]|nr:ATP-binding protein [Solirubrobacterales bacterium]